MLFRGVGFKSCDTDFNFTKVTILLDNTHYLFSFFQLLNSEPYRLRVVFRPPPDQIPFAVRSDCVRHPIGLRPLHDGESSYIKTREKAFCCRFAAYYAFVSCMQKESKDGSFRCGTKHAGVDSSRACRWWSIAFALRRDSLLQPKSVFAP